MSSDAGEERKTAEKWAVIGAAMLIFKALNIIFEH